MDRDDKMEEVLEACGPPFHQYILKQELIFDAGAFERGRVLATSEWLYNFGPNRLMVLLYFEDERLVAIEHRGRGLSAHARPATVCGARVVHGGDTQGEVLLKCGEPDEIDQVRESVEVRINDFQRVRGPLYSEKWIYEGSGEFLVRVLLFRNNRLQRIFIRDRDDGS